MPSRHDLTACAQDRTEDQGRIQKPNCCHVYDQVAKHYRKDVDHKRHREQCVKIVALSSGPSSVVRFDARKTLFTDLEERYDQQR